MARRTLLVCCVAALGYVTTLRAQIPPVNPHDGFDPGANNSVLALAVQSDGRILVGGAFTTLGGGGTGTSARNFLGRLNVDGSIDNTFTPGANERVYAVLEDRLQIYVGGVFTTLGGGGLGNTPRHHIGRVLGGTDVDANFNPDANGDVYALALQADGKILVGGAFTIIGGMPRSRLARLNTDGSVDPSFNPGANDTVSALAVQSDGEILVGGMFTALGGATRHHIGRIHAGGTLDAAFDPGANARVKTIAVQPDDRIVVGGYFTMLGGGGTGTAMRNYIGRLNANGSLDTTFDPGANAIVAAVTVQTDGQILVGGQFTTLGGGGSGTTARASLGRLRLDGTVDATFNPGGNGAVYALAEQPDRNVLVGGAFTALGGGTGTIPRQHLGRVYIEGSVDHRFNPGADDEVHALAIQPDGKIFVDLRRFNADGTIDATFNASADGRVNAVAVMPDAKILVAGDFTTLNGQMRRRLGRLNANGSLDTDFPDVGANGGIYALAIQPDGKIVFGGGFSAPGNHLARLNADGSLDSTFSGYADSDVYALLVQSSGRIVVGGAFSYLDGLPRGHIGRLNADGSLDLFVNSTLRADNAVYALGVYRGEYEYVMVGGLFDRILTSSAFIQGRLAALYTENLGLNPGFGLNVGGLVSSAVEHTNPAYTYYRDDIVFARGQPSQYMPPDAGQYVGRYGWPFYDWPYYDELSYASANINGVVMQPDGKILAGGAFTWLTAGAEQVPRLYVGRLSNTLSAALQTLSVEGVIHPTIRWSRGGTALGFSRVTFEASTDGLTFTLLGTVFRGPDSSLATCLIENVPLPLDQNVFIRARGYYTGGWTNSSQSIAEAVRLVYLRAAFTDDPLVPGVTPVRAVHITELRARIAALRAFYHLPTSTWLDGVVSPGTTAVRGAHILQLRQALAAVYTARGLAPPVYTDPDLPFLTPVKAIHIQQLRSAIRAVE
jgi:uncharacterized delta-60 repeat protein